MTTMQTSRPGLVPAILLGLGVAVAASGSARAIDLEFDPAGPLEINPPGTMFTVDVDFGGLGAGTAPSVGAFDIDVTNSNPGVLRFDGATFGTALGIAPAEAITGVGGSQSSIDLFEVSLLSQSDLDSMQPGGFTAVTLAFTALEVGESTLGLALNEVGDALGAPLGGITIGEPLGIAVTPLPGALALMASALGGLGLVAWRRRRETADR